MAGRWLRPPFDLDGWRVDVANMTGRHATDDFNAEVATGAAGDHGTRRGRTRCCWPSTAHDATGDLAGDGWHGTMNYAGFTRPVVVLAAPSRGAPALRRAAAGACPACGAEAVVATMRAFLGAAPVAVDGRPPGRCSARTTSTRIRSGRPATPSWSRSRPGCCSPCRARRWSSPGTRSALEGVGGRGRPPAVPLAPARGLGPDGPWRAYRELAALRRAHDALRSGGLRWVHADGDALAFLRESERERLLVLAARAAHDAAAPARRRGSASPARRQTVYGGARSPATRTPTAS